MHASGKRYTPKRMAIYLIGLGIYAFAVCLMTVANLGVSPITSIAYALSAMTPLTLGGTQLVVNILLVLLQIVWLGRQFEKLQLLQLAVSFVFSLFIDILMPVAMLFTADSLSGRGVLFLVSLGLMSLGLGSVALSDIVMLPGDGVARVLARKSGWPFGKGKVLIDCVCVALTCAMSLTVLGHIVGIQVGTVIAAVSLGNLTRLLISRMQERLFPEHASDVGAPKQDMAVSGDSPARP